MEKLEKKIELRSHQYAADQFSDDYQEEIALCRQSFVAGYKAGLEEVKDIAIAFADFKEDYWRRWSRSGMQGDLSKHDVPLSSNDLFTDFITNYYK